MPIKLIKEDEELKFRFRDDVVIIYRRIPANKQRNWLRECTSRKGNLDSGRLGKLALDYAIIDLIGFIDNDDQPVEFRGKPKEEQSEIIDTIPGAVTEPFVDVLLDGLDNGKLGEPEGNSKSTRSNG